jgi:hypothetical protein
MVSQRKQIANQSNASKSPGPRTDEGKQRSAQNRLRHGFFSRDVVLPGEDGALYVALLDELVAEHRPQTASQMLCVQRIASCTWKLRRVEASLAEAHEHRATTVCHDAAALAQDTHDALRHDGAHVKRFDPLWHASPDRLRRMHDRAAAHADSAPPAATLAASMRFEGGGQFERLARYEQRLQNMIHRALTELRKLRAEHDAVAALPESPYARQSSDEDESIEPDQIVRNEPTDPGEAPPRRRADTPNGAPSDPIVRNEPTDPAPRTVPARSD